MASSRYATVLPAALLIIAGLIAYHNCFTGGLVLDDKRQIMDNPRLQQLSHLRSVLAGQRPVVDLTLAVNYALGARDVRGYHAVNLAIHLAAGLTLFGLVRRLFDLTGAARPSHASSTWLAFAAALLWTVHPLQTQAVTYLIQRAESLMGLFYLLTLYSLVRAAQNHSDSPTNTPRIPWGWPLLAVSCCALGMGSKGVMVTAPLTALLMDRVFLSPSFKQLFHRRWMIHFGLLLTWLVLWKTRTAPGVLGAGHPVATVGFSYKEISPIQYALTEFGVILHYLRLSFWPHPLCLDYGWPTARTMGAIVPQGAALLALITATWWTWKRCPAMGFLALSFFLILAPTSSFIPIRDPAFEHRMYLSLACLVWLLVIGANRVFIGISAKYGGARRAATSLMLAGVGTGAVCLAGATMARNADYQDLPAMWRDIVESRPHNARARFNLGTVLFEKGDWESAIREFQATLRIKPLRQYPHVWAQAHYQIAKALERMRRSDEAAEHYLQAVQIDATFAEASSDLAVYLAGQDRLDEAIEYLRAAIQAKPGYAPAHFNLGKILLARGDVGDALPLLQRAVTLSPTTPRVHRALAEALQRSGREEQAKAALQTALHLEARAAAQQTAPE